MNEQTEQVVAINRRLTEIAGALRQELGCAGVVVAAVYVDEDTGDSVVIDSGAGNIATTASTLFERLAQKYLRLETGPLRWMH